jgi:hypothetical protein
LKPVQYVFFSVTNFLVPKTTTNGHRRSPSPAKTQLPCDLHLRPSFVFERHSSPTERPSTRSPSSSDPFLAQIFPIFGSGTDLPHFCVFSVVFRFAFFSSLLWFVLFFYALLICRTVLFFSFSCICDGWAVDVCPIGLYCIVNWKLDWDDGIDLDENKTLNRC